MKRPWLRQTLPLLLLCSILLLLRSAAAPPARGIVKIRPGCGPTGTVVTVTLSKFPANTTITIDFGGTNGITTINTDNNGAGTGTFTVPAGFTTGCGGANDVPIQVRARGGNPIVFGYAWYYRTA